MVGMLVNMGIIFNIICLNKNCGSVVMMDVMIVININFLNISDEKLWLKKFVLYK